MSRDLGGLPVTAVAFVLLISLLCACTRSPAQPSSDPAATVMSKCTVCHSAERICADLGRKDREEWKRTVARMVERGADVAEQDIPSIVDYLADLKPGSQQVCR